MGNLKVKDAEYTAFTTAVKAAGEAAEARLASYFEIVDAVLASAVTSGNVYENFNQFKQSAEILKDMVGDACATLSADTGTYIAEIDASDEYLY